MGKNRPREGKGEKERDFLRVKEERGGVDFRWMKKISVRRCPRQQRKSEGKRQVYSLKGGRRTKELILLQKGERRDEWSGKKETSTWT